MEMLCDDTCRAEVARLRYEQRVVQLDAEFEQRVAQRTAELRDMVAALKRFNRTVSHDLRGPLGGIAGLSRLATDALARGDAPAVGRMLSAITAQAESSGRLVTTLLALARTEDAELACQPVALAELVADVIDRLRVANPGAAMPALSLGELPSVEADPDLLRQAYLNLLANAQKFTAHSARPRVELGAVEHNGQTVLFVRDNGVGFDGAQAAKLFTPFKRLHGARFQGDGVGLSIVKRIIERHGGRIWAESSPGRGASFFFTLRPPP